VNAAGLGARKPSLFGPGFTMPVLVLREPAVAHNVSAMAARRSSGPSSAGQRPAADFCRKYNNSEEIR